MALRVFTAEFGMGSGVCPLAVATRPAKTRKIVCGVSSVSWRLPLHAAGRLPARRWQLRIKVFCRAIRTGQLSALPHVHLRPIDVVVFHGS